MQLARGHVEIALHGHSHRCRGPAHPRPSEFVGVDAREQATLIAEGARHLRGLFGHEAISGFVPPWNSYDDVTLAAVHKVGLSYLSAEWWHPPTYRGPLSLIPKTCQSVDLRSVLAKAQRHAHLDVCVVAVLHPHDFRETGAAEASMDLGDFDALMHWAAVQSDVQFVTLRDIAERGRMRAQSRLLSHARLKPGLPWKLRQRLPGQYMVDAPLWRQWLG